MNNSRLNYLWYFFLALFWSGSFLAIKVSIDTFPPIFCAFMRLGLSFLLLTVFFKLLKKPLSVTFRLRVRLWITGLFSQGFPFALLFYGEKFIAPAMASIINSTIPIWALLINLFIASEMIELNVTKISGLIIGLCGVLAIFWPQVHADTHSTLLGLTAVLGMAFFYAIGSLLTQRLLAGKAVGEVYSYLWHQNSSSATFLLLLSLLIEPLPHLNLLFSNMKVMLAFLYLGLFSTAVAWIIYFHLIRVWDAVRASSVTYVVPLMSILWDFLFLHLLPTRNELWGALFILLGVVLIQFKRKSV